MPTYKPSKSAEQTRLLSKKSDEHYTDAYDQRKWRRDSGSDKNKARRAAMKLDPKLAPMDDARQIEEEAFKKVRRGGGYDKSIPPLPPRVYIKD